MLGRKAFIQQLPAPGLSAPPRAGTMDRLNYRGSVGKMARSCLWKTGKLIVPVMELQT